VDEEGRPCGLGCVYGGSETSFVCD
jgi:hypothetical protein